MTDVGNTVVSFQGAEVSFGRRTPFSDTRKKVLDGVDLTIERGEMLCLLGPSGCGKTTMVNLVMGNLVPSRGTVEVMGEVAPYAGVRARIGFMPQDDALYDDVTAMDNLLFFGAMNDVCGKQAVIRAREMLAFARLEDDERKLVSAFSGGMKRRLSLGIAMMHQPELLVLDEPTVGLDPDHRRRIWERFEELSDAGCTLLVTTHVMDEAARCSRIAMLYGGRVIADGSPAEILRLTGADNLEDAFLALQNADGSGERLFGNPEASASESDVEVRHA